jgi:hypothetical protein
MGQAGQPPHLVPRLVPAPGRHGAAGATNRLLLLLLLLLWLRLLLPYMLGRLLLERRAAPELRGSEAGPDIRALGVGGAR